MNPFSSANMARGYANCRPPVHRRVLERTGLGPFHHALDIGCGAGVSTKALQGMARRRTGIEPVEAMLEWSAEVAPGADFLVGSAEALPVRTGAVNLITAAGSLNYVDLDRFFPEAARVLAPGGVLVVYDFQAGRRFRSSDSLERWFAEFMRRYPRPPREARELDPAILSEVANGFHVQAHETFETGIALTFDFYVDYMLTETNVAQALRNGATVEEVRSWCIDTLRPAWGVHDREVLFDGYFVRAVVEQSPIPRPGAK